MDLRKPICLCFSHGRGAERARELDRRAEQGRHNRVSRRVSRRPPAGIPRHLSPSLVPEEAPCTGNRHASFLLCVRLFGGLFLHDY